jgi:CRISPR/Cas system-associated protein endoribonuclease Cas2
MYVSEKQFLDMKILVGEKSKQEIVVSNNKMVII